jgi:capsular polysaccharide transport system permease protein
MLFYMMVEWIELPVDLLTMMVAWVLLAWFAVSLGLIVGAISELSEVFERIWHVMTYLFFPLSGAVYMVDWLPKTAQKYALWVPTVHGIEMLRYGYFGNAVHPHYNPLFLILVNLVLMLVGLSLVGETSRRVEPQ